MRNQLRAASPPLKFGYTVFAAMLTAAALVFSVGCSKPESPTASGGDIILITVDTLRPDHLGLYGYERSTSPHLERIFESGAVFKRAYATEAKTPPSVVSILTGLAPQHHRVRMFYQLLPEATALVTDLLPESYQTAAFVSSTPLTNDATGLASRFDHFDDFVDERESDRLMFERNAERTTDSVLEWIREQRDPSRPAFLFVHYIDPHGPYEPPSESTTNFEHTTKRLVDPARVKDYMRLKDGDETDGNEYVDRYDEEIAYLDRQIGRLLDSYAETSNLDQALVILTSDHGESLMDHEQWFRHGYHVYEEVLRVPLAIRGPGVSSGNFEQLASGIDITPTLLRFAGAEIPKNLKGIDLRAVSSRPTTRSIAVEATAGQGQWKAIVRGHEKWMAHHTGREGEGFSQSRYYDLARDPEERYPKPWPVDSEGAKLLEALFKDDPDPGGRPADFLKGSKTETPRISPRANEADIERLRALGYVD